MTAGDTNRTPEVDTLLCKQPLTKVVNSGENVVALRRLVDVHEPAQQSSRETVAGFVELKLHGRRRSTIFERDVLRYTQRHG